MKAHARPIIATLATVALLASIYALYIHAQMLRDPSYTPACDISQTVSCQAVLQSSYATVRGIPVAAGGAIWSALVLLLSLAGMKRTDAERTETTAGYVFVLSVLGLAGVFYLGYASFFIIRTLCPVCLTMYVAVVGIFLTSSGASSISLLSLPGRLLRDTAAMFRQPLAATLATSWIVGSVLLVAFFPRGAGQEASAAAEASQAVAPVEALTAEQLTEWHMWLDQQPRVADVSPKEPGKVLLIKFNDYQCPSCRMTYLAYKDIVAKYEAQYPGVFVYELRDFPLEPECGVVFNHYGACEAAVGARLAQEKGKLAEMQAWLYDHQTDLSKDTVRDALKKIAGVQDYDARYDAVLAKVREDSQFGQKLNVTGTPTFYLDGIKMPGVRAAHFDAAIAYEIQKVRAKS